METNMQELKGCNCYVVIEEIIETWILPIKDKLINSGKRTESKPQICLNFFMWILVTEPNVSAKKKNYRNYKTKKLEEKWGKIKGNVRMLISF